jgi:hypothetical protein
MDSEESRTEYLSCDKRGDQIEGNAPSSSLHQRSCLNCKRRKVRCDKRIPCMACRRSDAHCIFPPAGPRIRRTKLAIREELASRVSSLEKSLANAINHYQDTPVTSYKEPFSQGELANLRTQDHQSTERTRDDILVQEGSSSQYFNEILLSRVIREVSSLPCPS